NQAPGAVMPAAEMTAFPLGVPEASSLRGEPPTSQEPGPDERIQELLAFVVSGEEYAVDIMMIKEIIRPIPITYVPRAPRDVKGIISLRGTIVPIFDLPCRLGLKDTVHGKMSRIIVISLGTGLMGFMVDSVTEVVKIKESGIEPPPSTLIGGSAKCIRGIGRFKDRMIIILDVEKTLDTQRSPQSPEPCLAGRQVAGEFINALHSSLTAQEQKE
ncbi:MAG: chemotaxis protein CheW, partial [Nitrospiria bacterium]